MYLNSIASDVSEFFFKIFFIFISLEMEKIKRTKMNAM